jgi:hypothetical protein
MACMLCSPGYAGEKVSRKVQGPQAPPGSNQHGGPRVQAISCQGEHLKPAQLIGLP